MAGFLTYVAVIAMTVIWILGWMGLCLVVGSFFALPLRTASLVGAILGPLGLLVTIMLGILETGRRRGTDSTFAPVITAPTTVAGIDDPFA